MIIVSLWRCWHAGSAAVRIFGAAGTRFVGSKMHMAAVTHVHLAVAQALDARPVVLAAVAVAQALDARPAALAVRAVALRDARLPAGDVVRQILARRPARVAVRRILVHRPARAGLPAALAIRALLIRIMALADVT